ncbi:FAD-binding oxidoreductase [Jeotgalibacillus sp. ET6]|uniref:NAD(P)/FAD-dependent oxidoreductase n=1 Tax=Jeotgalibacillus sp. ET6 TaxID=3037260 RepID=UPI002418B28F|nr:FAD-binding oxidoreductase [Jeotgalibacillus sp. ET6]MDG5473029.1 FAD-binding oxidoreductase [Jeotgalibacillus sp. ET6]
MSRIIIIGAGILGASAAYHLSKKGEDVLIIDRKDKGQATDAAAGIVCPWLSQRRNKAWYELAKNGAKYYESLIPMLEEDGESETGYKKVGALSLHRDEDKLNKMEVRAKEKRAAAPEIGEIRKLQARQAREYFPELSSDYQALFVAGAARVDGRALRDALLNGARNNGATLVEGSASLLYEGKKVTGAAVNDRKIAGEKVIITAGAWAADLLKPLGINLTVSSQKAQIIHLEREHANNCDDQPVIMPPNDQYIVPSSTTRVIIGATHENDAGIDFRVTAGGMAEILDKALKTAPGLTNYEIKETRVGFRPFTPGFLPVIGEVPNVTGVYIANGLGASGLTTGPYLGYQLSKLLCGEKTDIDLAQYPVSGAITE